MSWLPLASVLQHARALHFFICFEPFAGLVRLRTCLPYTTRATADMGGILSRAEGSPKASQNACRQSVLGSIDLVSLCVDYLVVDELYGSARPVCHAWRAAADLTPGRLSLERRPGESRAAFNWIEGMSFQLIGGARRLLRFSTSASRRCGRRGGRGGRRNGSPTKPSRGTS